MPTGSGREWSDGLPIELLGTILANLLCLADRVSFGAVCRAWRSAARALGAPPPRTFPWLLLPDRDAPSFYSFHTSKAYRRLYLPEAVRDARFCGSHEGGWVAVAADSWRGHAAVSLFSGARVPLPDRLSYRLSHRRRGTMHPMVIRSVIFSAAPSAEGCLAAAHVSSITNIAFCRLGMDEHWVGFPIVDSLEDIIYHSNEVTHGFHVLDNRELINVWTPKPHCDRHTPLSMVSTSYKIQRRADYMAWHENFSVCRYLVESRGKLLMVLREHTDGPAGRRTLKFRVFEMKLEKLPQRGYQASWVELYHLHGRVILLGRGCSRAFEVSQFSGLQENYIYFLDDTSFDISSALGARQFKATDIGASDMYCIYPHSGPSGRVITPHYSPVIWIIH